MREVIKHARDAGFFFEAKEKGKPSVLGAMLVLDAQAVLDAEEKSKPSIFDAQVVPDAQAVADAEEEGKDDSGKDKGNDGEAEKPTDPVKEDSDDYKIYIFHEGTKTEIFVHEDFTIEHLQSLIVLKTGVSHGKQNLRFTFNVLDDIRTLGEYGIGKEDIVYMEICRTRADFVFQIFIKMPDGSSLTLIVMNPYRIKVVKHMINNATQIPRCEQRLWLNDNLLEDHRLA